MLEPCSNVYIIKNFSKKLRQLWLALRQLWLIRLRQLWLALRQLWFFATIVVGVATIVVDCDNCEHWDNCDHIKGITQQNIKLIPMLGIFYTTVLQCFWTKIKVILSNHIDYIFQCCKNEFLTMYVFWRKCVRELYTYLSTTTGNIICYGHAILTD